MEEEFSNDEVAVRPSNKTLLAGVKFAPVKVMSPCGAPTIAREGDICVKTGPVEAPPLPFVVPCPLVVLVLLPPDEELADPPPLQPATATATQMATSIVGTRARVNIFRVARARRKVPMERSSVLRLMVDSSKLGVTAQTSL